MTFNFQALPHVLFELTLFGIFVYYSLRLVSRHVVPLLRNQLIAWQNYLQELSHKRNALTCQREELESRVRDQKKHFFDLEQKIKAWHHSLVHDQKIKEQEALSTHHKIEKKREIQQQFVYLKIVNREVLPQALESARDELAKRYHGQEAQRNIAKFIEEMQSQ